MPTTYSHLFTPDEANERLDSLRPLVADMIEARDRILALRPALQPVLERASGNGGSQKAAGLLEALEAVRRAIEAVQAQGVVVKDVNTGLIDFPSLREGRVVFLCWKFGEDQVAYWHELDSGFAGRKEL